MDLWKMMVQFALPMNHAHVIWMGIVHVPCCTWDKCNKCKAGFFDLDGNDSDTFANCTGNIDSKTFNQAR